MADVTLEQANTIIAAALAKGREMNMKPLTVAVLDKGGHCASMQREDGSGNLRCEIAFGKAWGALGMGHSTRYLQEYLAVQRPRFVEALAVASDGRFIPVLGGVLIRDSNGEIIGAIGVTGDNAENDEVAAVAGVEAAGLTPDLS